MLIFWGVILGCASQVPALVIQVPSLETAAPAGEGNASAEVLGNGWESPPNSEAKGKLDAKQNLFLSFDVCDGAATQHLALIHGIAIGRAMGAVVVLPDLYYAYGRGAATDTVSFGDVYDSAHLRQELKDAVTIVSKADIQVAGAPETMSAYGKKYTLGKWKGIGQDLQIRGKRILHLTCTYDAVSAIGEPRALQLLWRIHGAIRLAPFLAHVVGNVTQRLRRGSPTGRYSALHLRVFEKDWVERCNRGEGRGQGSGGIGNYNCMANADNLHSVFAIERVPPSDPVYVAGGFIGRDFQSDRRFFDLRNNYRLVTKEDLIPDIYTQYPLELRYDILGVIDFYVCADSEVFIGNSLSAFSALLELGRKRPEYHSMWPQRRALHYNGGPIPLSTQMPIDGSASDGMVPAHRLRQPMKWVFTIGTGLTKLFFEHLRVSVLSALANTTLQPTCLYAGVPRDAPPDAIEKWLRSVGVVVIRHQPRWTGYVRNAYAMMPKDLAKRSSTNFGSLKALVATFLRIDIPILGFVDQYILYADVDTLFVSDPAWADFTGPSGLLPTAYTMGTENFESDNPWDGNAGVMFLNLHTLGESYEDFLAMTFSEKFMKTGLVYNGQPADQGAYKVMYHSQTTIVSRPPFNWRPYWKARDEQMFNNIKIIHFIGPKIADYNIYFGNGTLTNPIFKDIIRECDVNRQDCEYWVHRWRDTYMNCVVNRLPCGHEARSKQLQETALLLSSPG